MFLCTISTRTCFSPFCFQFPHVAANNHKHDRINSNSVNIPIEQQPVENKSSSSQEPQVPVVDSSRDNSVDALRPSQSLHFLVVDDVPSNRKFVAKLLGTLGHTAVTAENGVEAFEIMKQVLNPIEEFDVESHAVRKPFDGALMDFVMPKMVRPKLL
jgi:hypothetical protein